MVATEYVSRDIISENYVRSFSPFLNIEMLLGTCRISIKDKFVGPPTRAQKAYTILWIILTIVSLIYVSVTYFDRFDIHPDIYYSSICTTFLIYLMYVLNTIHVRFVNCQTNPKFFVQLQQIDRLMRIDVCKVQNNIMFKHSISSVISGFIILFIAFSYTLFEEFFIMIGFSVMFYGVLTCVIEWLHCSNLIIYFYLRMRFVNALLYNFINSPSKQRTPGSNRFMISNRCMRQLVAESHNFETSNVEMYVKSLFEAYSVFQKHYRFQIFLFFLTFFLHSLSSFEISILAAQKGSYTVAEFLDLPTMVALNTIIAICICLRCELFHREVKQTKRLCIIVLARYHDGPIRKRAKKILSTIEDCPPKFSVYGMWYLNVGNIVRMLNLVTTLIVALLQFAIL